jgi:hypothetical protein
MTGTFLLVCLAWIFFRAPDLQTALGYIGHMFSDITHIDSFYAHTSLNLLIPAMFAIDIAQRNGFDTGRYRTWYVTAEAVTLTCIMLIGGNFGSVEFIYFQF